MDLCDPMRVESINGKKYVLIIFDDYSRYTWTHFLRSKDETPGVLIDFLTLVRRGLHAQVTTVRTDKGMEFLNKTLHAYFAKEGIRHETSTARTPEQNSVVEGRNRTLVEAARTMLSVAKVPLEDENLDKMKEKGDACIFVGYSTQSKAYRVFNKRTRMIVETIHVNFDKLPQMVSDHVSSDPAAETETTSNELDLLFGPLFDEYFNGENQVVLKSSVVTTPDASNKPQQPDSTSSTSTLATTVTANKNFDFQKDTHIEHVIGNPSQSVRTSRQLEFRWRDVYVRITLDSGKTNMMRENVSQQLSSCAKGILHKRKELILKSHLHPLLGWKLSGYSLCMLQLNHYIYTRLDVKTDFPLRGDTTQCLSRAEYVSLSGCCTQVLMVEENSVHRIMLHFDKIPMYCDSKAAIAISCNLVQHSRTKHIDVKYHFIKEKVGKGFKYLVRRLGMRCLTPDELEVLAIESA
ncbi:retrovirus-related pol polyprotein from transposon TNT 1-94 [Tanacetum coccineum]